MDPRREKQLVRAAQRGDERAFGELYDAYVDRIYRYFVYRIHDSEIARDLTSEVFMRMVKDLRTFEFQGTTVLAWLYRIAHARIVDYYARATRERKRVSLDEAELQTQTSDQSLDSNLVARFRQQQIQQALAMLTESQQQVIVLRFIEGYDLQETAAITGKTVGAVKLLQYRAIQTLAQVLAHIDRRDLSE